MILDFSTSTLLVAILIPLLTLLVYRAFLSPLRRTPGPFIARLTSLWIYYYSYHGSEASTIHALHRLHGPIVRVGPNAVSIADGEAVQSIYVDKGGFMKQTNYRNFDIDGHMTIFSTPDPAYRAPRAKAVSGLFSTQRIRTEGGPILSECVETLVQRIQEKRKAARGGPVEVLDLVRGLTVDVVTSYLFGRRYRAEIDEREGQASLSASPFVDTFVAVGRFFLLPGWVCHALETASSKLWPDPAVDQGLEKVHAFCGRLVDEVDEEGDVADTYQARLVAAGISRNETVAQCMDLIFAGTDSTGQSVVQILFELVKQPEQYRKLREEVRANTSPDVDPQSLPYLRAVVKEGLRIAQPNPTRLPRVVPPNGWSFKGYHFPAGTELGCSSYSLEFDPNIFTDPEEFRPERWLDAGAAMNRNYVPFGSGQRACIARNLAMYELLVTVKGIAESDILEGAVACADKIEKTEWFNARVVGNKVELRWPGDAGSQ